MRQELSTIAKQELDMALSHGSGTKEATASLMARCRQDRDLMRQVLKQACTTAIQECQPHNDL
jgi:hypothetical protein